MTGAGNTADGGFALAFNTGNYNTATGYQALYSNTFGSYNTADGYQALYSNTTVDKGGNNNTAAGYQALYHNTFGSDNTATGSGALFHNTTGLSNTATGSGALHFNTTGQHNIATGVSALYNNVGGGYNTALGDNTLGNNTGGSNNTAVGNAALQSNHSGNRNTGVGGGALSQTTSDNNTAIGDLAGSSLTTGSNNIDIGYNVVGVGGENNTIRIGNSDITDTFIRGISGATVASGATVLVASNSHLGTKTSSARFKDEIKPMDKASEVILALKPVTFRYKKEIDPSGTSQFGLVAEEVEKVNPDLVVRDEKGKPYTVRYDEVNAMLLNEFLKEHRAFIAEQHKVAEQQKEINVLKAELKEQRSLIQKVTDKVELNRSMPQVVANDQ